MELPLHKARVTGSELLELENKSNCCQPTRTDDCSKEPWSPDCSSKCSGVVGDASWRALASGSAVAQLLSANEFVKLLHGQSSAYESSSLVQWEGLYQVLNNPCPVLLCSIFIHVGALVFCIDLMILY